jgi:glycosyltransferase involved in cell wall biosynthesis
MNLLIFNLGVNKHNPPLAFTIDWITEFAKHCESVVVLTMSQGEYELPSNVTVFDIGHHPNRSKLILLYNFYKNLFHILSHYKINGCFSHMNQLFSGLAGPILRVRGIPLVTWYAHPSVTLSLKIAHFFSNYTVASVYNAYPYKKDKLHVIGQGIDTKLFQKQLIDKAQGKINILCSGRISASKRIDTLIKAVSLLVKEGYSNIQTSITGNPSNKIDQAHLDDLKQLAHSLGITDNISFDPALPRHQLPALNSSVNIYINLTPAGFGDKVAWEAMSCETPTLVSNTDFAETLGIYKEQLLFKVGDEADLAIKIKALLQKTPEEMAVMGSYLRQQVITLHSLENLPPKILTLMA